MNNQVLLDVLAKPLWKKRAEKFGTRMNLDVIGDPYLSNGMRISFRFGDALHNILYFNVRIHALHSSCGVLEINRPRGERTQEFFDFCMDLVWQGLRKRTDPTYHMSKWGNQYLATYSTESPIQYKVWLEKKKWNFCGSAPNPRTGREISIWRKTL